MSDTAARIRKLVVQHLGVEDEKVTGDAHFMIDLGADSLDAVELVIAFEAEFSCQIPDDAVDRLRTVQEAVQFIESMRPSCK